MELTVRDERGVAVVEIGSELNAVCSAELEGAVTRLLTEGQRRFVIDCARVTFLDSAGLAVLVRCFKQVRSHAGNVCLVALQPSARHVIELTRLDRAFDLRTDATEAVQYLTKA